MARLHLYADLFIVCAPLCTMSDPLAASIGIHAQPSDLIRRDGGSPRGAETHVGFSAQRRRGSGIALTSRTTLKSHGPRDVQSFEEGCLTQRWRDMKG